MRDGCFAYDGLERALHEKARLGIMTALVTRQGGWTFVELKRLCSLTDGNLARHLEVLIQAGLVDSLKGSSDGRPRTLLRVTAEGRRQFVTYLKHLDRVVRVALPRAKKTA
jgi:DNA-binding MarR family transcriptional regulator